MRIARGMLGIGDAASCEAGGGLWLGSPAVCVAGQGQGTITPAYSTAPSIPVGYDASTGAVADNPLGLTQESMPTPGQSGQTTSIDPYSVLAQNLASSSACQLAGGTWDSTAGICNAAPNYTPLLIGGGLAVLALLLVMMKR